MKSQLLSDDCHPVLEEVKRRTIRTTPLEVLDFTPPDGLQPTLGVPGLVLVFVARKGSPILNLVRKANTPEGAKAFFAAEAEQRKQFSPTDLKQNIALMVQEDVFAELRHGIETLVQTLFVPKGADFIFLHFPYNGGPFATEGFTLVERVKDGSSAGLEALIVKILPPLTEAEDAALKLVPSSQWARNVGDPGCGDSWTAVGVALTAVAATVTVACAFAPNYPKTSLTLAELDQLGPTASARKLLELRRAAIAIRN